jgi:pimeloyl-ACP methyl ester carboxylesterase
MTGAHLSYPERGERPWVELMDLLADVNPIIHQPALMIYGDRDAVQRSENLAEIVPAVEVVELDCGHWIQQEEPEETNRAILGWLDRQGVT